MPVELFKIDKQKLYTSLYYINELKKTSIIKIDFTGLLSYDLTEEQKEFYLNKFPTKDTIEIIGFIYLDFLGE